MKKYQKISELDRDQMTRQQRDALQIFQYLLRNNAQLNKRYHDRALEIADGLQPWIEALEMILKK